MSKRVLILGAGLSGLAAAVHLVCKKHDVTILEKRPFAGGRVFSFRKNFWPHPLDNGPHVMLGCYKSLLNLLEIVGGLQLLREQPKLQVPFLFAENITKLKAAALPSPFHLIYGLLRFPLLNGIQKKRLVSAFLTMKKLAELPAFDQLTAADWLRQQGQDNETMKFFWRPLILATLNAAPEQVSFLQLLRVAKVGLLHSKKASRMILLPEGLTPSLIQPVLDWLQQHNCQIQFRQTAKELAIEKGRINFVRTSSIDCVNFDYVISSLPFYRLQELLHNSNLETQFSQVDLFSSNAIMNFHFWYPGQLISDPFAGFIDSISQWLFVQKSDGELTHYTVVVSGANEYLQKSRDEMTAIFLNDLKQNFSNFSAEKINYQYLTVEKNATLLCSPGTDHLRPNVGPHLGNLLLAGDWTNTGLPPTMESAAKSGEMVAHKIAELDEKTKSTNFL